MERGSVNDHCVGIGLLVDTFIIGGLHSVGFMGPSDGILCSFETTHFESSRPGDVIESQTHAIELFTPLESIAYFSYFV